MSAELTTYLLEFTLVWTILLTYYHFALRRNTHWSLRRRYLLGSWLLGLLLPLLPTLYTFGGEVSRQLPTQLLRYLAPPTAGIGSAPPSAATEWVTYILVAWSVGTVICLLGVLVRLALHLRPRPLRDEWYDGFRIVRSARVLSPYAAFRSIYLPHDLSPALERTALLHEAAHLRRGHHYERLLLTMGSCLLWFHPLAWYYLQLLTAVHEHEADAEVIQTIPPRTYGRQLLRATLAPRLVPALYSSPLKQRIAMLTRSDSSSMTLTHWSFLLVLVVSLLLACSEVVRLSPTTPTVTLQDTYEPPVLRGKPDTVDATRHLVGTIYGQIRYPEAAREAGEIGTVYTMLLLDAAGQPDISGTVDELPDGATALEVVIVGYSDTEARVDYPLSEGASDPLTEEALRTVGHLGQIGFEPARRDGEPVATTLYFAFTFALED